MLRLLDMVVISALMFSSAAVMLRGMRLAETMNNFYNSRKEYTCITRSKFKERVHQEIRRKKFIHYLATKTAEEKKEKKDRRREMAWTKADA